MNEERKLELLAYAKVCFDHCTSPFVSLHLIKKNVLAEECRDLSHMIAEILEETIQLDSKRTENAQYLIAKAEKEFMETQEE